MAFLVCSMHLDREVHTAGDLSDPVQQGFSSDPQTSQNKGNGSGTVLKTSSKTIFTTESATKQETS